MRICICSQKVDTRVQMIFNETGQIYWQQLRYRGSICRNVNSPTQAGIIIANGEVYMFTKRMILDACSTILQPAGVSIAFNNLKPIITTS